MKGLTVLLGVLASILLVIYSAGNPASSSYLNQTMYNGQSVFVEDGNTATVNGVDVQVAHQGFSNMANFQIADLISMEKEVAGANNTTHTVKSSYLILSHEIGGVFGKATPVLTPTDSEQLAPQSNGTAFGTTITYVGTYKGSDGVTRYLYEANGTTVVVASDTYSFIQTDNAGNGLVLRQEATGNVSAGHVDKPFDINLQQFGKLMAVVAVAFIAGYWFIWAKNRKIYGRVDE